jgi:hypothetical protein
MSDDNAVEEVQPKGLILSSQTYDRLKVLSTIVLPALATLYATLASIWGWPFSVEIVGTVAAFAVFLGVLLKVASVRFEAKQQVNAAMNHPNSGQIAGS